jgi:hypothetical protein
MKIIDFLLPAQLGGYKKKLDDGVFNPSVDKHVAGQLKLVLIVWREGQGLLNENEIMSSTLFAGKPVC